jgi:membrane protease subunit HflC
MRAIGVQIVDVSLKRVDLPPEVSESVYRRMETERKRVANELRSEGAAEAEKIKADADRQREVVVAEAYREAQKIKGEGDAKAAAVYARPSAQSRVLCLLPQPRGLPQQFQEQGRPVM